jgi:hypothetical protein
MPCKRPTTQDAAARKRERQRRYVGTRRGREKAREADARYRAKLRETAELVEC